MMSWKANSISLHLVFKLYKYSIYIKHCGILAVVALVLFDGHRDLRLYLRVDFIKFYVKHSGNTVLNMRPIELYSSLFETTKRNCIYTIRDDR